MVPSTTSEFRWLGQGPYAGYPGKDWLNEFGSFHLNRQDIRFQGNRRGTQVAILSNPAGAGLALLGGNLDVAVENTAEGIVLSRECIDVRARK